MIINKRIILIGEVHGTKEIPEEIRKIYGSLNGKIIYCLELPIQIKKLFLKFVKSKISLTDFIKTAMTKEVIEDGRITPALVKLLKGLNCKIEFIDDLNNKVEERDEKMAGNFIKIIEKYPNNKVILHCGNFHVLNKPFKFCGKIIKPLKLFLPQKILEQCLTIIYQPKEGNYYNGGIKKVQNKKLFIKTNKEIEYFYLNVNPSYFKIN